MTPVTSKPFPLMLSTQSPKQKLDWGSSRLPTASSRQLLPDPSLQPSLYRSHRPASAPVLPLCPVLHRASLQMPSLPRPPLHRGFPRPHPAQSPVCHPPGHQPPTRARSRALCSAFANTGDQSPVSGRKPDRGGGEALLTRSLSPLNTPRFCLKRLR